ncbi:protein kinase domain-containing protein [Rheinheimera soli]|uniref:Serine/threonine protein kinase n=1 Tax=Rheinheimera soli TaxID=443616 RepID=A0ABU1W4X0_9GAMM|nr:protein kinase [Rheinheimera soli]MDR7123014.1 serine/threonine protein kinase [Rheinheimera soli]
MQDINPFAASMTGFAHKLLSDNAETDCYPNLCGRRFGAYEAERLLSKTIMSVVYLAKRVDGLYQQIAVLKVLRADVVMDQRAGFMREWNTLAMLRHKNIAQLYDAGVSEDGLPFMLMEYVYGEPITRYCNRKRLSVVQRIALLRQVLDALSYAHVNLIVHQDIKPANVLVTPDREVKVLDFGIADALSQGGHSSTLGGGLVYTPSYASPEQRQGIRGLVTTDIWQAGLLLQELLTGSKATPTYNTAESASNPSAALLQMFDQKTIFSKRRIAAQRSATIQQFRITLASDLIAIINKAMTPEADNRYQSASSLQDDLHRYCHFYPVSATGKRCWRFNALLFIKRNFRGVITVALTTLMTACALWYHIDNITRLQAESELRANRHAAAFDYINNMITSYDPSRASSREHAIVDMLDNALNLLVEKPIKDIWVHESIKSVIARTYINNNDPKKALSILLTVNPVLEQEDPDLYWLSQVRLGKTLMLLNQYDQAKVILERTLSPQFGLQWLQGDKIRYLNTLADLARVYLFTAYFGQAQQLIQLLNTELAELEADAATHTLRNTLPANYKSLSSYYRDLAIVYGGTGGVALMLNSFDDAYASFNKALSLLPTALPVTFDWLRTGYLESLIYSNKYAEAWQVYSDLEFEIGADKIVAGHITLTLMRGLLLAKTGHEAEALHVIENVTKVHQRPPKYVPFFVAEIYSALGDCRRAKVEYEKFVHSFHESERDNGYLKSMQGRAANSGCL